MFPRQPQPRCAPSPSQREGLGRLVLIPAWRTGFSFEILHELLVGFLSCLSSANLCSGGASPVKGDGCAGVGPCSQGHGQDRCHPTDRAPLGRGCPSHHSPSPQRWGNVGNPG